MSPITVGAHWHNIAQRTYPEPAVSVEHVYIDDPSHLAGVHGSVPTSYSITAGAWCSRSSGAAGKTRR